MESNNLTTTEPHFIESFPFEVFAPTLAKCYLIIIAGYLVARFQILSVADQRGATAFVSYVGMPGIICVTLADADFSDFSWELMLALFFGKLFVFCLVVIMTVGITGNLGIAGVLAVFLAHCNDLPVGNPLMSALYQESRPHMIKYLFFMPILTVLIFVPLGHLLIELHKRRRTQEEEKTSSCDVWMNGFEAAFRSMLKYSVPITIATLSGIILNFIFHSHMHAALHKPLEAVANTVPGMVLAVIGFSFVRKERYLFTSAMVAACVLVVIKMFLTPIILHTFIKLLVGDSVAARPLSDFGLLYGIVSPATAIFLSGQEFRKPLASMSATLILTSLLSFPSGYVVARFTLILKEDLNKYVPVLKNYLFWIACVSILCDIYVLVSFLWKKKGLKFPYCYISSLVFTQILKCCGIIVWHYDFLKWNSGEIYFLTILYYGGEISCYILVATAAVLFSSSYEHNAKGKNRFRIISGISFCVCIFMTVIMSYLMSFEEVKSILVVGLPNTNFEYLQLTTSTVIKAFCFIVVSVRLWIHFTRTPKATEVTVSYVKNCAQDNEMFYLDMDEVEIVSYKKKRESIYSRRQSTLSIKDQADIYYKEIDPQYQPLPRNKEEWSFRFYSLLLVLMIVMFIRLVANLYKLAGSTSSEVMIPLEFFQSSMFIGQGIFYFLIFGIDARTITIKIQNKWRSMCCGQEEGITDFISSESRTEISAFCSKFTSYYLNQCFQRIARDRKWIDELYENCFWGHQLVDWMIEEGLAQDDVEAEELGQKLLLGGVIQHVTNSYKFYDAPYLYQFSSTIKKIED
ncbi:lysosomal cholesterol signaling protein isoform X1 [Parasteatoda tepidariorum]|uniref:lysosomal cholesterol signaling protein isoform X1 n=1 Tax=Parasteatoda tepidariorum TaxID=114398 RepID=UPI001C71A849|nr:integral membrane protein GPR155 [Parasteatoda tepidariorum]